MDTRLLPDVAKGLVRVLEVFLIVRFSKPADDLLGFFRVG
jgi:hypothetical protein